MCEVCFWPAQYGCMATSCYGCSQQFGGSFGRSCHVCTVCGSPSCSICSTKDLLVYIPDEDKGSKDELQPRIAIIKIVGVCIFLIFC